MGLSAPLRVLVIGAGATSELIHLPLLARLRDRGAIVLALVCDIRPDRARAAREKFAFLEESGDAGAALERKDIDAVYIFGSAQMHFAYGLAALRNGKHLFVEKPVAPFFVEARLLAETAKTRGLIAVGGHNRRFSAALVAARARAGAAGWQFAEAVFHKPEAGKPPLFGARTWLSANGVHALDALVFMMGGLPAEMTAFADGDAGAPPNRFSALMRWPGGATASFLCNNDAGGRREDYAFHSAGETCRVTASELVVEKNGQVSKSALPGDGFAAEHGAFLRAIRDGSEPLHSLAALAPSLFLAELIEQGFSGPVKLPLPNEAAPPPAPEKSILVADAVARQPALARLLPDFRLVSLADACNATGPRPDIVAAILGNGTPPLAPELLDRLPGLAVVGVCGLSLARHAPQALLARGITLVNAGAAYADSVAEFALGLAILGRRRAFASNHLMHTGGWGSDPGMQGPRGLLRRTARRLRPMLRAAGLEPILLPAWKRAKPLIAAPDAGAMRDLRGAHVGLIGWGANARAFAERLTHAGAHVSVWSQHACAEDVGAAKLASLADALGADIVSLHRGLTPKTRHAIGAAELDRLKPGAVLINLARGALIDPVALLARLRRGDIFACLDTFEEEPLAPAHLLRRLPNVFLTSHIAGGSPDMHAAAADEVIAKVAAYLRGETVSSISAARLETMT